VKGILEFNLPEEELEHLMAVRARSFVEVISALDKQLRDWQKYDHKFEAADDALEKVHENLWKHIEEEDLAGFFQ
jgi:hypothetical protein